MIKKLKAWLIRRRNRRILRWFNKVFWQADFRSMSDVEFRLYKKYADCCALIAETEQRARRNAKVQEHEEE